MTKRYVTTTVHLDADDMYAFRHMLVNAQTTFSQWVRAQIREAVQNGHIDVPSAGEASRKSSATV